MTFNRLMPELHPSDDYSPFAFALPQRAGIIRAVASWGFLKDGAGILPASNMADPLRSTSLRETEVLVREAVQNSLDERRLDIDRPVRIRFERIVLAGEHKERFVEGLHLRELSNRRKHFRASHNWFAGGSSVLDAVDDPAVALPILTISDYNANGLGGRWNRRGSKDDRFFNLVLSIGGSRKWEEEDESDGGAGSLGSYGYGKMAFAMCSEIRTIIYYSTFSPDEGTAGVKCRAMATSFLPPHTVDCVNYAGQAYFGCDSTEEGIPRGPFVDGHAHGWIHSLGLPPRSDAKTGTTVVIPATTATMRDIIRCCETWWWPRLRDPNPVRRVAFDFVDEGEAVAGCNPRSRSELSPFIDCFRLVPSHAAGDGYDLRDVEVRPEGAPRTAGRLVLKAIHPPDASNPESGQDDGFRNRVALLRDGLVIRYESRFAHEDKAAVVGVFVPDADPVTLQAFVFSEPPSHDEWEENAGRLRGKYSWGRDFLRLTKNRLRNLTRDFQGRQAPQPDTERADVDGFLRRILGDLFNPPHSARKRSGVVPPPTPRPRAFTISTRESGRRPRVDQSGDQEDFATFRIGLSEHAPVESATVDVTVSLKALADADAKAADPIRCEVTGPHGVQEGADRVTFRTEIRRDEELDVKACGRVHPCWKTQWEIAIDRGEE